MKQLVVLFIFLLAQARAIVLQVLPDLTLNYTMLTEPYEHSLVGHLHYMDNLCELDKWFKMPQRFGQIQDFVIAPRQQNCSVGDQVRKMA